MSKIVGPDLPTTDKFRRTGLCEIGVMFSGTCSVIKFLGQCPYFLI